MNKQTQSLRQRLIVSVASAFSWLAVAAMAANPVNVNTASAEEIADSLVGVGEEKAEAIVAYREQNGPFTHVDQLVNVKGIGLRTVDQNRGLILTDDRTDARKPGN